MNKIKDIYFYLFYKLYKLSEAAPSRWLSEWKANLALDIIVFFLIISFLNYYNVLIDSTLNFEDSPLFLIFGLSISLLNLYIFSYKGKWKIIVKKYDNQSVEENNKGSIFIIILVIMIIANLIFSFILFSNIY